MRAPEQMARLREHPEYVPSAVDELLRYEPPVQLTTRSAKRPMTLGGQRIEEGEGVVVHIAAANRDPEAYRDPDRLDVARFHDRAAPPPRHLGFSLGIHYCLGAPLAMLEMEILLHELIRRAITMEPLTDEPPYKPNLVVRGLSALPVRFGASS